MSPQAFIDMSGERYGALVAVEKVGGGKDGAVWLCRCDCGAHHKASRAHLRHGTVASCGCKRGSLPKHGDHRRKLYGVWRGMRSRCTNPNHASWKYYGGKGVSVCPEWNDYETFRDWAEAHGYAEGLTIERVDGNNGYNPENCKWATWVEQNQNRTRGAPK